MIKKRERKAWKGEEVKITKTKYRKEKRKKVEWGENNEEKKRKKENDKEMDKIERKA